MRRWRFGASRTDLIFLIDDFRPNRLSTTEYAISGTATELLQSDDATFRAFAAKVQADVESTLSNYDIQDHAALRDLLWVRLDLQLLAGNNKGVLETIAKHRPTCVVGNAINYQRYDL